MTPESPGLPLCPHLPDLEAGVTLDWQSLHELGEDRGDRFYLRCLTYAHYLWVRGLAARAILAADRAVWRRSESDLTTIRNQPAVSAILGASLVC